MDEIRERKGILRDECGEPSRPSERMQGRAFS
jgi:hypothetical protein